MLELNTINYENIKFFNEPDKKLLMIKHWKCSWRDTNSQNSSPYYNWDFLVNSLKRTQYFDTVETCKKSIFK
jgi:hypothetical protein